MQKWGTGARARTDGVSVRSDATFSRCRSLAVAVVALLSRNVVIVAAVGRIVVVSERRAVEPSGCVSLAPPAARVSLSIRHHQLTCIKSVRGLNQFFLWDMSAPSVSPHRFYSNQSSVDSQNSARDEEEAAAK